VCRTMVSVLLPVMEGSEAFPPMKRLRATGSTESLTSCATTVHDAIDVVSPLEQDVGSREVDEWLDLLGVGEDTAAPHASQGPAVVIHGAEPAAPRLVCADESQHASVKPVMPRNCPQFNSLPHGSCVEYWKQACAHIDEIQWNWQDCASSVLARVLKVGEELADMTPGEGFYVGISSWPLIRFLGGYTGTSGRWIHGHHLRWDTMEIMFFTTRNEAVELEKWLISEVRMHDLQNFGNKSAGGECCSVNSHNFFVYVAWNHFRPCGRSLCLMI